MATPRPFGDNFVLAVRKYLHENHLTRLGQINAEVLAGLAQHYYDHHQARQKQRKRGDATAEELAIYEAYPKKVGRELALRAIHAALDKTDSGTLQAATRHYADCVARWPASFRYKEGRDTVPYPASWFNAGRYADSPKEWLPAGMFTREDDPRLGNGGHVQPRSAALPEPANWKELLDANWPDCRWGRNGADPADAWQRLPDYLQEAIAKQMSKPALPDHFQ